jgi:CBS domain containing-hemolysin-like protein
MTKYVMGVVATAVSIALMWVGEDIFATARVESGIPLGRISLGTVMFFLSGAVFAVIFLFRARRDRRYGYLVPAAVALAIMTAVPLLWYAGAFTPLPTWLHWIASPYIQGAVPFALGGIIVNLIWSATASESVEEPN